MFKKTVVPGIVAVLACAALLLGGCDLSKPRAWGGVIVTNAVDAIDTLLGKERVARQHALDVIADAEAEAQRLELLAATARVDADLSDGKAKDLHRKAEAMRSDLARLAELLKAGEPVVMVEGATLSADELQKMAQKQIAIYNTLQEQVASAEQLHMVYATTAERALKGVTASHQNLEGMHTSLDLLDAKVALLQAVRAMPNPEANQQLGNLMTTTGNEIDSLVAQIDRETRVQEELHNIQSPESAMPDVADLQPAGGAEELIKQLEELAAGQ